ncbi:MAG: hypothetical protein KBG20_06250, partial [Caldilineaceae bacterium]|nr:hypothetical protein [Caldilineaceae bacterium]
MHLLIIDLFSARVYSENFLKPSPSKPISDAHQDAAAVVLIYLWCGWAEVGPFATIVGAEPRQAIWKAMFCHVGNSTRGVSSVRQVDIDHRVAHRAGWLFDYRAAAPAYAHAYPHGH